MIKKIIKNKKEELEKLEKKIHNRQSMDRLLKMDSCDWCLQELWNYKIEESQIRPTVARIMFNYKEVKLCEAHLQELAKLSADAVEEFKEEKKEKIPRIKAALI